MTLMELKKLLKWIIAQDIAVKDKKDIGSGVAFENFLGQPQWASCSQGIFLLGVGNFDFILLSQELQISLNNL